MVKTNKIIGFLSNKSLTLIILFLYIGYLLLKKVIKTKEHFSEIEDMELDDMINEIDSMNLKELNDFEKKLETANPKGKKHVTSLDDVFKKDFLSKKSKFDFDLLPFNNDTELEEIDDEMYTNPENIIEDEMDIPENNNTLFDYGIDNSFSYIFEGDEVEDEMDQNLIESSPKTFSVGQILDKSEINQIKDIINDEMQKDSPDIDDYKLFNAEKLIKEDKAHRDIGDKKVLDLGESSLLNSLYQIKNGFNKMTEVATKLKDLDEENNKKVNTDILNLLDKSEKIFTKKLKETDGPAAFDNEDDEFDNNLVLDEQTFNYSDKDNLVDTNILKSEISNNLPFENNVDDLKEEAYEGEDKIFDYDELNAYDSVKLVSNDNKLSHMMNENLKSDLEKKFTIDEEGVRNRLHVVDKAGLFIKPTFENNFTYDQMKTDDNFLLSNHNLQKLRETKKIDKPMKLNELYSDSIHKPKDLKSKKHLYKKIQKGLNINDNSTNYYLFNPNIKDNEKNSDNSLLRYDTNFSNYSNYE